MALVKCPECAASISENAVECPQCGYPCKKAEAFDTYQTEWQCQFCGYLNKAGAGRCVHCGGIWQDIQGLKQENREQADVEQELEAAENQKKQDEIEDKNIKKGAAVIAEVVMDFLFWMAAIFFGLLVLGSALEMQFQSMFFALLATFLCTPLVKRLPFKLHPAIRLLCVLVSFIVYAVTS